MTDGPLTDGRAAVEIVQVDLPTLRALADGDAAEASARSGLPVSAWLAGPDAVSTWRRRVVQLSAGDRDVGWVTGIVLAADGTAVGRAGFHEAPDGEGRVEIGYAIDPAHRRRGYAAAAVAELVDRARREPAVRVVRACVSPDNLVSQHIVTGAGLVRVGEVMDDEDGLEWVFERPVPGPGQRRPAT